MGFLSLQTLIDRYMETVGYRVIDLQSAMAGPCANHQLGTLQNEMFFAMDGHLTKAGYDGELKFSGSKVPSKGESSNPLAEIPETYFRIKREFRRNEINGLSLEADMKTFADTRKPSERHPYWIDVQVATNGVPVFLASQQHAAATMTGAIIGYSAKKDPTLCEAISILAFGSAVDRDSIAERLDQSFKQRTALVESVLTEAAADPAFNHFPKNMPLNEEQIILMFFEERTPKPWPVSTQTLIDLCAKTNRQHHDDDYKMTKAMAFIHEAARMGHLKVYGKVKGKKDAAQISATEFNRLLSLNFLYDTVSDLGLDGILNGERWVDVTIDGADFEKWLSAFKQSESQYGIVPQPSKPPKLNVKKGKTAAERLAELMMGEWPNGLPHNLKAPDRNRRVNELSKEHGGSTFGDRTMVRALEHYNARAK